ncbi:MAG TPA: stage 0 sporulation family protein [Geopsychrobacteraceae bacterium]|nr:stage 0 sporulation family protein [Geopsychrobacteraceae bacterium]
MDKVRIVAVSFQNAGKIFDFNAGDMELAIGDKVIVETERGRALATVVILPHEGTPDSSHPKLKNVLRTANEADLEMANKNAARETEALHYCKQRVKERKMEMKLVRAEYLFDGSKIVFFFTADGRVDFRELVRDLAQYFRTRIEMRQIGVRDEAKMVGGLGVCGRELCCCTHLRNFAPVSVKMAKAQGLALNPNKISGQCGRLLCCLGYEYETYNDLRKNLPKCGKKITLDSGQVDVIGVNVLKQSVTVYEDGQRREVTLNELKGASKEDSSKRHQTVEQEAPKQEPAVTKKETTGATEKNKPNRRRGRRHSGSGRSDDNNAPHDENRNKERREKDKSDKSERGQDRGPVEKRQSVDPSAKPEEKQENSAKRPRRRRRRPRNRPKPTSQNDNNK